MTDRDNGMMSDEVIAEAAVEWLLTLEGDASEEERAAFKAWLSESAEHWKAFSKAKASLEEIDDLGALFYGGVVESTESPEAVDSGNVLPMAAGRRKAGARRNWVASIAAAAAVLVVAIGVVTYQGAEGTPEFLTTEVGKKQLFTLEDGSTAQLNTRSRIAVEITDDARRITLLEGEAVFDVAQEPERPFTVIVGNAEVTALGTRFNVYKKSADDSFVTLVEGRVSVAFMDGGESTLLEPGMQAVVDGDKQSLNVSNVDINDVLAWRTGKLIFNERPLSEVVAQFNRYHQHKMVIVDTGLKELQISGSFDPQDRDTFIKTLAALDVEAAKASKLVTLLRPAE